MASTYSTLKFELIGTGDQSGTWGVTTNTNLGTAIQEAIAGRANAVFASDADLTLTLTDTNGSQVARNYILNVTSSVSLTVTRNLIVPTISKPYIVENLTSGGQSIIVKTAAGTGITIANGARAEVYADGTNVVQANYFPVLSTPSASITGGTITGITDLAVADGGTGASSFTANTVLLGNGTSAFGTVAPSTSGNFLASNGTTWVSTTTLAVANGGTGASTSSGAATNLGLGTASNVQFNSLGVGTAGSATAGEIRATNNITAYFSDERLKTNLGNITDALNKVCSLNGFYYEPNEVAQELGYKVKREVGVSAQQVQAVLPEIVTAAPVSDEYLTIYYDRLTPLLIEAIKELKAEIDLLKGAK